MPQLEQRYFRRNEGSTDYATHSSVTVDRIVMDVIPGAGNGNLGLPTGAPAVTDSVLQTIDFAYSGTISELYRNGSDYFSGIIANVKYYLSGELIHSWSINSNSSTESDSVGGLVLTFINGNADDWGLFDRQADGDWLGQELSNRASVSAPPDTSSDGFYYWTLAPSIAGIAYRISAYSAIETTPSALGVGWSGASGVPASPPFRVTNGTTGVVGGDYAANSAAGNRLFYSDDSGVASFDNISVKEVLKNA